MEPAIGTDSVALVRGRFSDFSLAIQAAVMYGRRKDPVHPSVSAKQMNQKITEISQFPFPGCSLGHSRQVRVWSEGDRSQRRQLI